MLERPASRSAAARVASSAPDPAAVRAFQREHYLPETGRLDAPTRRAMDGLRLAEDWRKSSDAYDQAIATQGVPPKELRERLARLPKRLLIHGASPFAWAYNDHEGFTSREEASNEAQRVVVTTFLGEREDPSEFADRVLSKIPPDDRTQAIVIVTTNKTDWRSRGAVVGRYLLDAALLLQEQAPETLRVLHLRQYRAGIMPPEHRKALRVAAAQYDLVIPSLPANLPPDLSIPEALLHARRHLGLPPWRVRPAIAFRKTVNLDRILAFEAILRGRAYTHFPVVWFDPPKLPEVKPQSRRGPKGPHSEATRLRRVRRRLLAKGVIPDWPDEARSFSQHRCRAAT